MKSIYTCVGWDCVLSSWPGRQNIVPMFFLCTVTALCYRQRTAQPPAGTKHTATCWADVRKPPGGSLCCWNNTLHINTWPCGEGGKKNKKTLGDHVLRSMPKSRPTEWKGQLRDKEAEEVKALGCSYKCWSFSSRLSSFCWIVLLVKWPNEDTDTTIRQL